MLKRPLAGVVLLLAGGIAAGWLWPVPWWRPGLAAGLTGAMTLGWRGRGAWFVPLHVVAAGMALVSVQRAVLSPHDLRRVAAPEPQLVKLTGRLVAAPEMRLHERDDELATNTLAMLDATVMETGGRRQAATGRVMVSVRGPLPPEFRADAVVEVEGVLRPPPGPSAPGLFDYAAWLRTRGIHFELRAGGAGDWRLAGPAVAAGWAERFQNWAQGRLSAGLGAPDRTVQLIFAMVLGWKAALTDEVEEPFMRSGTMHLFAISGLHIALIAAILAQALRVLLVPRPAVGVATIAAAWAYTAATGWQPSAVRATIMTTVVVGGWMLHRQVDLLNSLAAAALAILLWDARQLFAAGFQLSFAVVGALGLLLPRLEQLRDRVWAVDPFLPADALPRWQRWTRPVWRLVTANVAVSLAAWLGSLPLTAHYFHLVPPVGLLANLVVVPLGSAVLVCALASLAFAWWPAVAELFNHSAWLWMRLADEASRRFAEMPGGVWHAASPPWAWTMTWFLVLALVGLGRARWSRRRWAAAVAVPLVLFAAGAAQVARERSFTRLTVLPLRGGHAVFLEPAHGGPVWLVDTGDEPAANAVTQPILMARGVNRLPTLALTHGDIRHVGGAPLILRRFRPRELVVPGPDFRSAAWDAALEAAVSNSVPVRRVAAGDLAGRWRVLHPSARQRAARADDASLALAGTVDGLRVALVADLSRAGQETWLNSGPLEPVDVLVTGLAEGRAPSPAVLAGLRPRLILVADAAQPATARAPAASRAAFQAAGVPVIFLSDVGGARVRWREERLGVEDPAGRRVLGLELRDGRSAEESP